MSKIDLSEIDQKKVIGKYNGFLVDFAKYARKNGELGILASGTKRNGLKFFFANLEGRL